MLKIAIVGNIASGKSTVEKIIESKGFNVYDSDKIAHEILASNEEVKQRFGTVDRKELAKIVFSNLSMLKMLESIIHPLVKQEIENIFQRAKETVFISVPQLFEAGFESLFDKIIYVTAEKNIRLERLMKRNNLTKEEALVRINAQKEDEKIEKSDFVIQNNNSLNDLEKEVENVLNKLN